MGNKNQNKNIGFGPGPFFCTWVHLKGSVWPLVRMGVMVVNVIVMVVVVVVVVMMVVVVEVAVELMVGVKCPVPDQYHPQSGRCTSPGLPL